MALDTRRLLCYYVLSGRYSHWDEATYAKWAPNSGTEEWLAKCSRPASKQNLLQRPIDQLSMKEGYTDYFSSPGLVKKIEKLSEISNLVYNQYTTG